MASRRARASRLAAAAAILAALTAASCSPSRTDEQRRTTWANAPLAARLAHADPQAGAALFSQCATCHSVAKDAADRYGPNLYGVLGKPVGRASERFATTAALQEFGGTWTFERMDAWLEDPKHLVPRTRMVYAGLPNGTDRADLIAYLNENGSRLPLPAETGAKAP